MKLFQKLIAAPAIISLASGFAVNATEINSTDLSDYSNSNDLVSLVDFKSDTLFPGDWAYDSLKNLTNSSKFNGNSVSRLEAAAELSNLIAGGEGLINGAAIDRLSDELGSELAIMKGRVDGLESRLNTIEAGSFSDTATVSFKAQMAIGAVDGKGLSSGITDGDEAVNFQYTFDTKIKTSFTGEDSLTVAIDSGNGASGNPVDEFGLNNTADALKVDGVAYKFPVGDKLTVLVSDGVDGSKIFTTACAYGGPSDTLDDCGNVNANIDNAGASAMAEYDIGNGFTAAVGYAGSETGLMTTSNDDAWAANLAYTGDNYGLSVTYGVVEDGIDNDTYTALNGFYSFDNGLNISAGYEVGDKDNEGANTDETEAYFIGINGEVGPGELGAALGTNGSMSEVGGTMTEELMYEAYYSYPLNDGMTITPLVFIKEQATAGTPDQTGVMVKTTFKF
ncbi:carbohydrate porin [Prochlorococcus sp. AH-716-M09]|nr:carbohydrate porin [Prochlorococcus sp. AH-716-M09]